MTSGCASSTSITCSRVVHVGLREAELLELVVVGAHERAAARRGSRRGCARASPGRAACRGSARRRSVDAALLEDLERAPRLGARLVVEDRHVTGHAREATAPSAWQAGAGTRPRAHVDRAERCAGAASSTARRTARAVEPQQLDRRPARDLRRVGHAVEHRLAREEPADAHAVEPADELAVAPRLDAVRPAQLVQARVRVDERLVDPAVRAARIGAAAHHRVERGVDPDLEARGSRARSDAAARGTRRAGSRRADRATTTRATPSARIGNRPRRYAASTVPGSRSAPTAMIVVGSVRGVGIGQVPDATAAARPASRRTPAQASSARAIWPTWISSVPA